MLDKLEVECGMNKNEYYILGVHTSGTATMNSGVLITKQRFDIIHKWEKNIIKQKSSLVMNSSRSYL